jgi:hypothetical protein
MIAKSNNLIVKLLNNKKFSSFKIKMYNRIIILKIKTYTIVISKKLNSNFWIIMIFVLFLILIRQRDKLF